MVAVAVRETARRYGGPNREVPRVTGERTPTSDQRPATSDPPRPSEATLAHLWAGQRFPASALVTRQGAPLRVLHPGQRGRGAGPDFRDALIATPSGGLLRGDVELHVRASDFQAHGHGGDGRYNGVVLHVVFEDDAGEDTRLASGNRVPVVALAPWVRRRASELESWLAGPGLWREPCHDAVARLGEERVLQSLEELGDARFQEKESALAAAIRARGPGEALYRALLAGLGYGGARPWPGEVAEALLWPELCGRIASAAEGERGVLAEALLLGAAGLLPSQGGGAPAHPHEERLEALWSAAGPTHTPTVSVEPNSGRPANHPARRLAGLGRLLARHNWHETGLELVEMSIAQLVADWTVAADGYWRQYVAPGLPAKRPPGALIGRSRAIELLANAVLPWRAALAEAQGDAERAERSRASFARLPRPASYGVLGFLETNLRGTTRTWLDARRQQGLLALYKMECTQGGCGRCPLS